jgi:quercetin dioxygenase-like cupin family protein
MITVTPAVDIVEVPKPWGRELWWANAEHYMGKTLEIRAGHSTSLHYHQRKHETLLLLTGAVTVQDGDLETALLPGDAIMIDPWTVHRIRAAQDSTLVEVSTGHRGDVVRVEDAYGRVLT